jgi:hypothetical protein
MDSIWKMNFLIVCLGVALVIVLTKATSLLAPHGWYFTFSGLLYGVPERPPWPAVLIKFAVPIVAGLFVGFFAQENPQGTAGAVGFSSAFILAWPAINAWELYVTDERLLDREYAFKIVYLLYFLAYSYLAIAGARLTTVYLNFAAQQGETRTSIIAEILDWKKSVKPALIGVGSSAVSFIFSKIFSE